MKRFLSSLAILVWMNLSLQATPLEVMIISYAEPSSSYGLTATGYERSELLVNYFEQGIPADGYPVPDLIVSAQPSPDIPGSAAILTVSPTSGSLTTPIHTRMPANISDVVDLILTNVIFDGKTVLIAWDFSGIPSLISAFGYQAPSLPNPACYSRTYVLPNFPPTPGQEPSILNQDLIAGDPNCGGHPPSPPPPPPPPPTPPIPPSPPPPPPPPGPPVPAAVAGYTPFVIYNGSQTINDNEVFFVIVVNSFAQAIQFTEDMSGHFLGAPVNPTPNSANQATYYLSYYSKNLAELESFGMGFEGYYVFYLPTETAMAASRIYFSIGSPLNWWITSTGQIQQLDNVYDQSNPTYYKLFDKLEFTTADVPFGMTTAYELVMNSTLVDFYSLPLSFYIEYDKQDAPMGPTTSYTGLSPTIPRESVFSTYISQLTTIPGSGTGTWSNLVCSYTSPNSTTTKLRLNASNAAIKQTTPTDIVFPTNYLQSNPWSSCEWLSTVWSNANNNSFYHNTPLTVGLSLSPSPAGTATGTVNSAGDFVFNIDTVTPPSPGSITFPRPTSAKAFFTGAIADYTPAPILTGTATADNALILWQIFSCAFNAGFHPALNTNTMNPLNQNYIRNLSASYYTNNANLCTGPWYDFYSQVLYKQLGVGNYTEYYTSPFTDVLGISGVITVVNSPVALPQVFVTLGSLEDTILPDPFDDSNLYNVHCDGVGSNTSATLNGMSFATGTTIPNLTGSSISLSVTFATGPYAAASPWVMQIAPSIPIANPIIPGGAPTMSLDTTTTPPTLHITLGGPPS